MTKSDDKPFGVVPVIPDHIAKSRLLTDFDEPQSPNMIAAANALADLNAPSEEVASKKPASKPTSKPKPTKTTKKRPPEQQQKKPTQKPTSDAKRTRKVNFSAGVPVGQLERFENIEKRTDFSETELFEMLFAHARKNLTKIPVEEISFERQPEMSSHRAEFQLRMPETKVEDFSAQYDLLSVMPIVDVCRNYYVAAFIRALDELEAKLPQ